jgi:hypothetical protein
MKFLGKIASLSTIVTVSACGGTATDTPATVDPAIITATAADGTVIDVRAAVDAGTTFTAQDTETTALSLDYSGDTTTATDTTLTFRVASNGDFVATINGVETVFTADDLETGGDGYSIDLEGGGFIGVFGQSESLQTQLATSGAYSGAVSYFSTDVDDETIYSYAVIGARTATDVLPAANATYEGRFKVETVPATDFDSFTNDRTRLRGDVTLTVDMDGTISGRLHELTAQQAGSSEQSDVPGEVVMAASAITAGAFGGALTASDALVTSDDYGITGADFGTYAGRFYGPDADEATGTITVAIPTEDGIENGVGYFSGDLN